MPSPTRPRTLALFATCLVDQLLPEVGIATVKLLRRAGFEVDFPVEQTCCGQPWFNSGFRPQAERLARRTIEIFEAFEAVVLPSGSCTAMLRVEYPHMFEDAPTWKTRAETLASKTFELSEFLARFDLLPIRPSPRTGTAGTHRAQPDPSNDPAVPLTYHDSCHMCRGLGLRGEPRAALRAAGAEIVEMAEPDRCCGFGGLFSLQMPEVSAAMTGVKLENAAATGAQTLVTADPGCLMHMRRFAADDDLRIEHLAVVLEERTR